MKTDARARAFNQGFVCACATIVNEHGADTIAKDALRNVGEINWDDIDEFDKAILRRVGLCPPKEAA